jgi:D-tyrosyl-tRNA(Tyr) deacylase
VRAIAQRVRRAAVRIEGRVAGEIGPGLLVFLGVGHGDTPSTAVAMADKVAGLRLFDDADGRMNLDLPAIGGAVLCVSQFTLYGDLRRGRRPSFTDAAEPALARDLYGRFCAAIEARGLRCERGVFGAAMEVELVNDGPVTLILDSEDFARPRRP